MTFPVWESILAVRLGLSRAELAKERKLLQQGLDWEVLAKRICWSQEAVDRLVAKLGQASGSAAQDAPEGSDPTQDPDAPRKPAPAPIPAQNHVIEEMIVNRWKFPNRRIIECRRQDGSLVFVRVKDSKNFRPFLVTSTGANPRPMIVRAFRDLSCWTLMGHCPRWPGKW